MKHPRINRPTHCTNYAGKFIMPPNKVECTHEVCASKWPVSLVWKCWEVIKSDARTKDVNSLAAKGISCTHTSLND